MEAAVLQPTIEDMLAYTDGLKQRLLRQTKETRHAPAPVATNGNTHVKPPTSTVIGNDLDMVASNGIDLTATTAATCSTQCPSRAVEAADRCMRQSRSSKASPPAGSVRRAGLASSSEATDPRN
jgi:coenzyme F420-reducing hydrogenase gamma subunit